MTSPSKIEPQLHPGWTSIAGAFLNESGVIHVPEPPNGNRQLIIMQLLDGIYPHPFVIDDGKMRRLHFSLKLVQSEMRIEAPDALALTYTHRMMGFLLFNQAPKHVVIVGLGGGSLSKYCYRHLVRCRVTTVEMSEGVIACRPWFMIPADDERMRIVQADAAAYFAEARDGADAILLDAYDADGMAPQLCSAAFYANARRHLKPDGVLIANVVGHGIVADTHIDLLRQCFDGSIVTVDVAQDGNRIVFAFNNPEHPPVWQLLERTARELDDRHGLDFARLLREMQRSEQRLRRKGKR